MHPSRMRMLKLLGALVTLVVFAIACAAESAPTPTPTKAAVATPTATATPRPAATSTPTATPVVATPTPTSTATPTAVPKPVVLKVGSHFWSPYDPVLADYSQHLNSLNFDRLLRIDEEGNINPQLASSWELVNATTWRFKLRNDVKFHDGTPLTAQDVAFSVKEKLSKGGGAAAMRVFTGAEAVDNYTVDMKTSSLDVKVPRRLVQLYVVSKKQIDQVGWDGFNKEPVGSGPWRWTERLANDHLFAERFPGDHPFRKVNIDKIQQFNVAAPETSVAALRTGGIDYATNFFYPEQAKDLEQRGFRVRMSASAMVAISLSPAEACVVGYPTCDKRVRRALNLAIDRKAIAETLYLGYAQPLSQPGLPGAGYNKEIPVEYDPAQAERLLDQAGFPRDKDGVRLRLRYMNWIPGLPQSMALSMVDMWSKIGVKMDYELVEIGVAIAYWFRNEGKHVPPLFQYQSENQYGDNSSFVLGYCDDPQGKKCTTPHNNAEFFALQKQIASEPDPKKGDELLKQAMRILVDDPPTIYIVSTPFYHVSSSRWEGGGVGSVAAYPFFDNMHLLK